jgi:hypothetical protein
MYLNSNIVIVETEPFSIYGIDCLCTYETPCDTFSCLFYTCVLIYERSCRYNNDARPYDI